MPMTVRDLMTAPVYSVRPSTPLKEVARLLVEHRISGVPVVDETGTVLGVVSEADLLIKEGGLEIARRRRFARFLGEGHDAEVRQAKIGAITAGEAMTKPAATIDVARSATAAATMMVELDVNRLPVVEFGKLVGIVSRADLVRAFVLSDDQLAETIRHDVLLRVLWLNPTLFDVSVVDGVVSIGGRVERRSTADMIVRAIRTVPGVVDVSSTVAWEFEDDRVRPTTQDPIFPFSPR